MPTKAPVKKASGRKVPARKAPAKKAAAHAGRIANPYDKNEQPNRHAVAALLLKSGVHSIDELRAEAGGTLSPRTLGGILVDIEDAGWRGRKFMHSEWGLCYETDKTADLIGKHDGADATGEYAPRNAPVKKAAPAKGAAKKTAAKKKSGVVARKPAAAKKTTAKKTAPVKKAPAKKVAAAKKAVKARPRPRPRPTRK